MLPKCLNCRDKQWKNCCYKCREQPYECFICNGIIKERDRNSHISKHYEEVGLYLTCSMCKVEKRISYFRFKTNNCRLCVYLQRYRFGGTRDRFNEYVKIHNIGEAVVEGRALLHQPRVEPLSRIVIHGRKGEAGSL